MSLSLVDNTDSSFKDDKPHVMSQLDTSIIWSIIDDQKHQEWYDTIMDNFSACAIYVTK